MSEEATQIPHIGRITTRDDYCTPPELFREVDYYFDFTLDAAASPGNALCAEYYTDETPGRSALENRWVGRVWCNPPFSQKEGVFEAMLHWREEWFELAVLIVPNNARESRWWRRYALEADEIINLSPRVNFLIDGEEAKGAPFGSCLLVYRPRIPDIIYPPPRELYWKWK